MGSSRRNLLLGLGGIVATSGALVGTGALDAFTAQREANIPITSDNQALVSIEVGPGESDDEGILQQNNGTLGIDFTAPSGSNGVQPDATYQLGGIDVTKPPVDTALSNDNVASSSGFPSPLSTGNNANDNAAILVRNNSTDLLGITADFFPGDSNSFPNDGRIMLVTHDRNSSVDSDGSWGDDMRVKIFGPNGETENAGGTAWRPAQVGESVGISIWIYTGTDPNGDLSGELRISAVDNSGGVIGDQ